MDPLSSRPIYYRGGSTRDGMRYKVVEGLFYYYTNETISIRTGYRIVQPTGDNAPGITEYMSDPANWKQIPEEDLTTLKNTRSPTLPTVAGTAAIVLSPHTIRNWSIYDMRAGLEKPGLNMPNFDTPQERAIAESEGIIAPERASMYRVNNISATFVPLSTQVDYSTLLDGEKEGEGMELKKMGQELVAKAVAEMTRTRRVAPPTLRTPQQRPNERNPSIDTKASVVYGSVIDMFSSTSGGTGENVVPITYLPASYDGIFPEIISYTENPNLIWKMTYTDFLGGNDVRIRTNVDSLRYDLGAPKPFTVAKTINEAEEIKGQYADRWVNVADETITYGALTMTVPREFRNVVSTLQSTTKEVDGNQVTEFTFSAKNIGFCLLTWDFEFKFL